MAGPAQDIGPAGLADWAEVRGCGQCLPQGGAEFPGWGMALAVDLSHLVGPQEP